MPKIDHISDSLGGSSAYELFLLDIDDRRNLLALPELIFTFNQLLDQWETEIFDGYKNKKVDRGKRKVF